MHNFTSTLSTQLSIVNSKLNTQNNRLLTIDNSKRVDLLVSDHAPLIDPQYRLWFVRRFYRLTNDQVNRLATQVRETKALKPVTDERRLFSWLIKRECGY